MSNISIEQLKQDPIGCYPSATVACFDPTTGDLPRRQLDHRANVSFLEKLAAAGVPAVLIAASTGHGHLRTFDELKQWFQSAAEANLSQTVKMALLRPEDSAAENQQLVELLAKLDYPVVFVRPGTNLPADATDAQVAENMRPLVTAIAEANLTVGLYSIPDVSGVILSPAAAIDLVNGKGGGSTVAIKVTESDYTQSTVKFLQAEKLNHLKIVQGWDPFLAQALQEGPNHDAQHRQRCGITSGPMSFALFQYQHILQQAEENNWEEVFAAQQAVTQLFAAMQDDPTKFADLQRAKQIMGLGHPLTAEITQEQIQRVFEALETLPRKEDQSRLARSLDLMEDGPYHDRLNRLVE